MKSITDKKQALTSEEELLQRMNREIATPCISIIMPLYYDPKEPDTPLLQLDKIIRSVKQDLELVYPQVSEKLGAELDALFNQFKITNGIQGVGFYVSLNFSHATTFPFPIMERIQVSDRFAIRELLYKNQLAQPYLILILGDETARLFQGCLNQIREIRDEIFPLIHFGGTDQPPAIPGFEFSNTSFINHPEQDRSELKRIRFETFLHQADDLLDPYTQPSSLMVVCGVKKYTAPFLNRSRHVDKLVSVIHGSYETITEGQLVTFTWPVIRNYLDKKMGEYLAEFLEKMGRGLGEEGIQDVWEAIIEGRGSVLLVEKDYQVTVYQEKGNEYRIYLHPSRRATEVIPDAVHELIQRLDQSKARIIFLDNGMLGDHQHITLITRY